MSIRVSVQVVRCWMMVAMMAVLAGAAVAAPRLYLSGYDSGYGTSLFSIDPATGADTWLAAVRQPDGAAANISNGGLAYDPVADILYATGTDVASVSLLFRVDRVTGIATVIGPTGGTTNLSSGGLTFDTQARVLYGTGEQNDSPPVQASRLYALDTSTGAATDLGHAGTPGTYLHGLGYDPQSGQLYALGYKDFNQRSALFTVDKTSGHATFIGENYVDAGRRLNYGGLAFHPETHVLYGQGSVTGYSSGLYRVDPGDGWATLVGEFLLGNSTDGGLVFIDDGLSAAGAAPEVAPRLRQNYPNPFNPQTAIRYELPADGPVRLAIFDPAGRRVRILVDGTLSRGEHEAVWDGCDARGRDVGAGAYLARLEHGGIVETMRMSLVR